MADIAAVLHALEGDLRDLGISLVQRSAQIGRDSRNGEYTPSRCDELAILDRRPGVEDDDVLRRWLRDAVNRLARSVLAGVAAARRDDARARAGSHLHAEQVRIAIDRRVEEVED